MVDKLNKKSKIILNIDEQYLIETNKQVLENHKKLTGEPVWIEVFPANMAVVFPKINSYGNSGNLKEDLIEKASCIMAVIAWKQVFMSANRRTGIMASRTFLLDNGYDLYIDPAGENLELRTLLSEIKRHYSDLDSNLMKQLFLYVAKRMKQHE